MGKRIMNPCSCGSMKRRCREVSNITNINSIFYVRCPDCGKVSSAWLAKNQAIRAWNKENPITEREGE